MILPQVPPTLREKDAFTYRLTTVEVEEIVETDEGLTVYMKRRNDEEDESTCPNCGCDRENDPLTPGCVACLHVLQDLLLLVCIRVPDDVVQHWDAGRVNAATEWAASTHVSANDHDDVEVPNLPAFLAPFQEVD